jgi:hypothetical protein
MRSWPAAPGSPSRWPRRAADDGPDRAPCRRLERGWFGEPTERPGRRATSRRRARARWPLAITVGSRGYPRPGAPSRPTQEAPQPFLGSTPRIAAGLRMHADASATTFAVLTPCARDGRHSPRRSRCSGPRRPASSPEIVDRLIDRGPYRGPGCQLERRTTRARDPMGLRLGIRASVPRGSRANVDLVRRVEVADAHRVQCPARTPTSAAVRASGHGRQRAYASVKGGRRSLEPCGPSGDAR